jgi:hypothetical protein
MARKLEINRQKKNGTKPLRAGKLSYLKEKKVKLTRATICVKLELLLYLLAYKTLW